MIPPVNYKKIESIILLFDIKSKCLNCKKSILKECYSLCQKRIIQVGQNVEKTIVTAKQCWYNGIKEKALIR